MKTIFEIALLIWILLLMAITACLLVAAFYGEFRQSEFYHDFFEKRGNTE